MRRRFANIWSDALLTATYLAQVHLVEWENLPGYPHHIRNGQPVAIKHCLLSLGGGRFSECNTLEEFKQAGKW